jgi:hypothetical protein
VTTTEDEPLEVEEPEEPEPETPEEPEPEPATETEDRCKAETSAGGTLYRCSLEESHDDEHRFQVYEEAAEPEQQTAKEQRKNAERLAAEAERHAKRIREILGADAESLVACELCSPIFGGWRFDVAPSEEQAHRVRAVLGMPDLSNYAMSATERLCDDCRGLGKVRTGSMVQGRESVTCDACAGKGYVASRPRLNTEAPIAEPAEPENGVHAYIADGVKRDMFGTPEGDPDYGKLPNMRARPTDYWTQAKT